MRPLARVALRSDYCQWTAARQPDSVPLILNASDALLVTSRYEGSPNIVKEAMACGLPVVTVPVGDVAERLAGVSPSWIVPP